MSDIVSKLTPAEREVFESAMAGLVKAFPQQTLLRCPLGQDATIEIRVSRWPRDARDIDAVMAVIKAIRDSFERTERAE